MELYGRKLTKRELLKRVGDISQVGGVRRYCLSDGNEKGVEAVDFRTGTGFNFTVLPGRGMDISYAEYQGKPICWRSMTGEIGPAYFEPEGLGWLRSFFGGLLTTGGLTYAGPPCTDEGEELGLHGRISNIPAKNVLTDGEWDGDDYVIWVRGKVREARVYGENIQLTRKIRTKLGETKLHIEDEVENLGFEKSPHMILYHINGGFPVIENGSRLISPTIDVEPTNEDSVPGLKQFYKFQAPTHGFKEECFYHRMSAGKDGYVHVALINKEGNFGFYIKYKIKQLPEFIQWKMNNEGVYAVGIEPANSRIEGGRSGLRKKRALQFLAPGEKRRYEVEIGVLSSRKEIAGIEEKIRRRGR